MFGVFLAFHDAAGERLIRPLDINSFWLPPTAPVGTIDLSAGSQTGVLIEIDPQTETTMITNFDQCTVLGERNFRLELPLSSVSQRYTILLREGDHILTSAGRWEILWEDEHGSIHNSMRPPALPRLLLPSDALEPLNTGDTGVIEPEEATISHQSPSTASTASNDAASDINPPPAPPGNKAVADIIPSSATARNDVAADNISSSPAASNDEVADVIVSSVTSIEAEPTPTPHGSRKRSAESISRHESAKRVCSSPSTPEGANDTDPAESDAKESIQPTIEVIVHSTPRASSARKKKNQKTREASTASPASNTRSHSSNTTGWAPVVYMAGTTTIDHGHKKIMRSFGELGGSITKSIVDADVLCVGKDKPLQKSGSLLLAITSGKIIVTEDWIIDATRRKVFPDAAQYLPQDTDREQEWGFNLAAAVARGRKGLTHLLSGCTVYLTKRLQQSVSVAVATELSKLATALGAEGVKKSGPSKRFLEEADDLGTVVVLGADADPELSKLVALGLSVYSKELLTMAALRGSLEFKEYALASAVKEEQA